MARLLLRKCGAGGDKQGYRVPMLSHASASLKGSGWDEETVLDLFQDTASEMSDSDETLGSL